MSELSKHGRVGLAALRSGMDRKTARKYRDVARFPSELVEPRTYRTRCDPFEKDWPEMVACLRDAPELEAKALFEYLLLRHPDRYEPGQLRTFQRRVKQWQAEEGPGKEVYFPQAHRPGEAGQTDFTDAGCLGITINDEFFDHKLCHVVLPYSNWEWATICRSESMPALKVGVQAAYFRLGRVPKYHQTDNSTAATHNVSDGRKFNEEYVAFMEHLGMTPRTIAIGEKHQNGDVEAANGALKRRLKQHLLLRQSRDFDSVDDYQSWLEGIVMKVNELRRRKVEEELAEMRPLDVRKLVEFREKKVRVKSWSTIRILNNTYSVPSRLRGEDVTVRIFEDRLEVWYAQKKQLTIGRLLGQGKHRINYRHVIQSLVRKPGAFERYRFREEMFPTSAFRVAYDVLQEHLSDRSATLEYLRLLELAAETMEDSVEAGIELLLEENEIPLSATIRDLMSDAPNPVPKISIEEVDLVLYDCLLEEVL